MTYPEPTCALCRALSESPDWRLCPAHTEELRDWLFCTCETEPDEPCPIHETKIWKIGKPIYVKKPVRFIPEEQSE